MCCQPARLLEGSLSTTRQGQERVQDAYTLRCIPQIHGASRDAISYVFDIVSREVNAATDNPLIFLNPEDPSGGDIISGGNFHGQPVALAMDFLGIALAELANVSERRIERLVNPALSNGLPAFLVKDGGLNSGFMIVQYTAASLVSENKVLAHPASVDSIPSSANQEDHVSMGTTAARKAREILGNARTVLALELLAACQAIDLRGSAADFLSPATAAAYRVLQVCGPDGRHVTGSCSRTSALPLPCCQMEPSCGPPKTRWPLVYKNSQIGNKHMTQEDEKLGRHEDESKSLFIRLWTFDKADSGV
jgi:histidine ammonia-lyase